MKAGWPRSPTRPCRQRLLSRDALARPHPACEVCHPVSPQFRRAIAAHVSFYFWRASPSLRLAHLRDDGARCRHCGIDRCSNDTGDARAWVVGDRFTAAEFWTHAFQATYAAELRAEGADRARLVYEADRGRYDGMTETALRAAGFDVETAVDGRLSVPLAAAVRRTAGIAWWFRRVVGKLLSIMRLAKGVFTFDGGVDYILWKIERHSGVKATATPWQRRHPLLAAPALAWRLYRRGAFR
jgi:hypothetical protein